MFVTAAVMRRAPELLITSAPLPEVVSTGASKEKATPVRLMPLLRVVFRAPLNVLVPEPSVWTIKPAVMACVDTLLAEEMVSEETGVTSPISAARVILPVPAS